MPDPHATPERESGSRAPNRVRSDNWPPRHDGWFASGVVVRAGIDGPPRRLLTRWSWSRILHGLAAIDRRSKT